jgi:hypothetical protein
MDILKEIHNCFLQLGMQMVSISIIENILGNGCGYSNLTKNYPYLYWPAPNFNINTSSSNAGDYLAVFKYSVCV